MMPAHDFAVCLSITTSAALVAWPLWALDRTIAEVEARMNRRIHKRNVREICGMLGLDAEAFGHHLEDIREMLTDIRKSRATEDEALPLLIASVHLSRIQGISISGAICEVMRCLR